MKKSLFLSAIFFSLFVFSSFIFASKVMAEMSQADYEKNVTSSTEKANHEGYVFRTVFGVIMSLNQGLAGCVNDCKDSPILSDQGAIKGVGSMIATTYQRPAGVDVYLADVMKNMNIISAPVYAQGIGFSALQPILELWKIFRNISYIFFVFIFLAIGFGIMFRQNLGGQTAVTIQQALPRIIIALLAVSFSYAIAGLLIDFMWVTMYFLVTIFSGSGLLNGTGLDNTNILNYNIFELFWAVISGNFAGRAAGVIGEFVAETIGDQGLNEFLGSIGQGLANVLGTLILFVAIVYAMFRTFFALIKVYLEIILLIVFAPLILMMGAINGNAFGNWFKGLLANLAVFPVLLVFIIIGFMLINTNSADSLQGQFASGGFVPPFVPGRGTSEQLGLVGGIAAIMLLPEVVNIVGKYKPSSIFDEFGAKAWGNAMAGRPIGVGMAKLGAATIGGTAVGAGVGAYLAGRGNRMKGAGVGALTGFAAPTVLQAAPYALRGADRVARTAQSVMTTATVLGPEAPDLVRAVNEKILRRTPVTPSPTEAERAKVSTPQHTPQAKDPKQRGFAGGLPRPTRR